MHQFLLVEFADTSTDILVEHKVQEFLLFALVLREDSGFAIANTIAATDGGDRVSDVGENVVEVAVFGINEAADFDKLLVAIAPFGQTFQESFASVRTAPELA